MKRLAIILLSVIFLNYTIAPVYANGMMPQFLCEIGVKFYEQGRYAEALHEFKKALIVQPNYEPALKYIEIIEQKGGLGEGVLGKPYDWSQIEEKLSIIEKSAEEKPPVSEKIAEAKSPKEVIPPKVTPPKITSKVTPEVAPAKISYQALKLDESLKTVLQPINIEQGKAIIILGKNIQKFLVTQPNVLAIEKRGVNELLITGKEIGYTYVHVWDDSGRWTLEFLTVPPRPEGQTLEEEMRKAEEASRNFRLKYSLDWSSFETGRRLSSLNRSYFSWQHGLNLTGETPYGMLDSGLSVRSLRETTDLTYFSLGLTQGKIGPFKDFSLHTFDYTPPVSNLAFSGVNLRGLMLNSPAFDKKLDYTVFWGREGGGRYAGLSPGLTKIRNLFLSGFDLNFAPIQKQNYSFSVFRGWGRDRAADLNSFGYDLGLNYAFDKLGLGYEAAFDSETFAHLFNMRYNIPKFSLTTEVRETSENFRTLTGLGWRLGELGVLTNVNYAPFENLNFTGRLDIFKDRLFPNPKNHNTWNEDLSWGAALQIDPLTSLRFDYAFQNDLGRVAPVRLTNTGIGLYKTFDWIKKINTNINYRYYKNLHFTSPSLDYTNNKLLGGFRFNLIDNLNYFFNHEISRVEALNTDDTVTPRAFETGVDYSSQVFKTPFYDSFRFSFRDEENTLSPFSFLSGQDYIEGYAEVSYRPNPDTEAFFNTRVRNIWAENPSTTKSIEIDFRAGMRYVWDTGLRWESVGSIEGYVFKDLNSDGLLQDDESLVEGIKVWLGKDKFCLTDKDGYYEFKKVRGRKAFVSIDTSTLPAGHVLTVPASQETAIEHNRFARLDFGVVSRSEISGYIFEDADANGEYSRTDKGVAGVIVSLETGKKVTTDVSGRYVFANASAGAHTITLDLNSIPLYYLPQAPLKKEITLSEGVTYLYNVPLKKIKQ